MHLATRGHFRSRDKDGGHTIRSAIADKPKTRANLMSFLKPELLPIEVSHCGDRLWIFYFLLSWPWSWPDDIYIRTWPVFHGEQKWTSYVKVFESYRLTDRQTNRQTDRHTGPYTTPLRGWSVTYLIYSTTHSKSITRTTAKQFLSPLFGCTAWPAWRRDEVWCLTLEQINSLLCTVSTEQVPGAPSCWRHRL